jgi:hypothetical protein
MIIQIHFSYQAVQYFSGDTAVIARVKVGKIIECISQQVIDGTAYSGPGPGDQGFEKLEKVHGFSLIVMALLRCSSTVIYYQT